MSDTESDTEMQTLIEEVEDTQLNLKKEESGPYRCTGYPECTRSFERQVTQAAHCKHCLYARAFRSRKHIKKRRRQSKRRVRNKKKKTKAIEKAITLENGTIIRPYKGFNWKDFPVSPKNQHIEEKCIKASELIGERLETRKLDQQILDHYVNVVEFAHKLPGAQKRLIVENMKRIRTLQSTKMYLLARFIVEDPENEKILNNDDPYFPPSLDNSVARAKIK